MENNEQTPSARNPIFWFIAIGFVYLSVMFSFGDYSRLASHGKPAIAHVVTSYCSGGDNCFISFVHSLAFDNMRETVTLLGSRHEKGTTLNILYLPEDPSTLCEGVPGMNKWQLWWRNLNWYALCELGVCSFLGLFVWARFRKKASAGKT